MPIKVTRTARPITTGARREGDWIVLVVDELSRGRFDLEIEIPLGNAPDYQGLSTDIGPGDQPARIL
jgi:hypothetical protein